MERQDLPENALLEKGRIMASLVGIVEAVLAADNKYTPTICLFSVLLSRISVSHHNLLMRDKDLGGMPGAKNICNYAGL